MADYQLIIDKANEIIQLATNAKGVSELIDSIDVNDGAVINPVGTELNFVDTSGETKDLITAEIAILETNLTNIDTAIDELADEIIAEL